MVQTNYFVEIRRRALEIDWRVPVTVYDEADLVDAAFSELLLSGRYIRVERDLLVVAPQSRGVLFHRCFDPEAQFAGSPLKLGAGQAIPMSWAAMMVAAPSLPLDPGKPPAPLDAATGPGFALEATEEPAEIALGGDYLLRLGAETRLWVAEGARGKPWTVKLLRGALFCVALVERPPLLRLETLRGVGRLSGGALGAQMLKPRRPDLVVSAKPGSAAPARWEMGGFGYNLGGDKPALAWLHSGAGPEGLDLDGLSEHLGVQLGGMLETVLGRRGALAQTASVAKPYRAPKPRARANADAHVQNFEKRADLASAAGVPPSLNGHAPAIAPIVVLDRPVHTLEKYDGDIELRLSVDQGVLYCRRADLASVEGSGTGALFFRGSLNAVNATMAAVTYEQLPDPPGKPAQGGAPTEKKPVMVTVFARVGGRLFESNLPLEQLLVGGSLPPGR
jgi:hypothetical protein